MEAEARAILLAGLEAPLRADLSWIEQLVDVGREVGGVELTVPPDQPATAAELR